MDDPGRPHIVRYVALAVLVLVVGALLFPIVDGLNAAGFLGEKTYLLILQDNSEIRGTGGLISLMGVLTVKDGHIVSLKYYYSHSSPELRTIVPVDGPESFTSFFGVNSATLYDSNVQYDFASFAPKVQSDWYNVTGQKVDGVIGLDFTAVQAIMNITGPITVSNEVITSRNVFDRLEYDSATSGSGGGQSMADLLSALTFDVLGLIRDSSISQKLALYTALQNLANEKHFFIYPDQGPLLPSAGVESRAPTADFISVIDMNLGNGKSDFGVNRTIDYHVQLLPDGSAVSNLTLTYTNGDWWSSDLFTQALVPPGAELISVHNDTYRFSGTKVTNADNFTAFSSRFIVAAHATARITYLYKMPNRVDGNGIGSHYDLYVVKQSGITRYALNVSVQLPAGAKIIHAENLGSNLVLTKDAHVSVVYTSPGATVA